MREKLYLETSVVSYYTSKPASDVVVLARQRITEQWWARAVKRYSVHVSAAVVEEAGEGDPAAARKRLEAVRSFPLLAIDSAVEALFLVYLDRLGIPRRALRDAVHLATASVHRMDYLVTWNCAHIANGEVIKRLVQINTELGISIPVVVTPEELLEDHDAG